jgi:hypothetical protein
MNKRELGRMRKQAVARRSALMIAILLAAFGGWKFAGTTHAANPTSGSISATTATPVTWMGNLTGTPPAANGEPTCVDTVNNPTPPHTGNCDWYTLTVNGNPSDWVGKRIRLKFTWTLVSTDYDMVVRKESNGVAGPQGDGAMPPATLDTFIDSSARGTSTDEEVVLSPAETGTGDYYVRAIYFAPNAADQYNASATVFSPISTAPTISCATPTFDNYQPPVGYPRRDSSGEPSVGVNWNTGNVLSMSRLHPNRTTFNDATSPADPNTTKWFSASSAAIVTGLDPILFTDPVTGRTIAGELQGAAGITNGVISDDDLTTITQTFQTGGPTQGVDHQTIGGGPPKKLVDANGNPFRQPTGSYPHLFYYASQQTAYASVATSFDGGITYQPAVPAYTLAQCTNLHGHIKVAGDGTVYLPNRSCGSKAAVVVSENNGLNWSIRAIPPSSAGNSDPSVGIGSGGKIYVGYTAVNNHPKIAVSDDRGLSWHDDTDLSTMVTPNLTASVFPQVVAGDNNRAAFFFIATSSTNPLDPVGNDNGGAGPNFAGTWYPYIATTCDGGKTWTVVRADNDPLHPGVNNPAQQGVVCTQGTTCPAGPPDTRNLLDFNEVAVDARGRIVAVYADGCNFDHPCIGINDNSGTRNQNQGVARLTLIRQRGGSRLFSEFDAGSPSAPFAPFVEVKASKQGNALLWGTPDDRGSSILRYRIYRGAKGEGEKLLAEVKAGQNTFVDSKTKRGRDYYDHVTAVNAVGESPLKAKAFVTKSG